MKKLLLLILALALSVSLLTACQGNKNKPGDTDDGDGNDPLTTADILGFEKQSYNVEFDLLLNDRDRNVIDFYADENSSDKLSLAVLERNLACEEYLGIEINLIRKPGAWNSGLPNEIHDLILEGACTYDMVAMGLNTGIIGGYIDIYKNIIQMDSLQLEHAWWVQDLIDQVSINNQLYFLTGDACISTYTYIGCIFANLKVAEDFNLDVDFYEIVKSGNWTMDEFFNLFKKVEKDNNGNGKIDYDTDVYGWCNFNTGVRMMWSSANVNLIVQKEDGTFAPVKNLDSRTLDFISKIKGAYDDPRSTYINSDTAKVVDTFVHDRVLFVSWYLYLAESFKANDMESPYAILPLPKYDGEQKDYISTNASGYNALFFPKTVTNETMSAQVAEYMGWYGKETVVPEYYDHTLKYRQNDVEQNIEMLDLIRDKLRVTPNETYGVICGDASASDAVIALTQTTDATAKKQDGFYTIPNSVWDTRYSVFERWTKEYVLQYFLVG